MQPTRPEHVQELAFRLIESLTTCFQSKSAAELRSLIELERAIDTQGILRKRAPLRLYVQSCRSHLAEEWHEVINGWHPIGPPAFLGGLNERLNEWSIVERVTAAITESGRRMALDLAHPGLADPLDAGSLINISASARSVLTTYSDSLDDLMGVLASPGDSVLAEEGGPIVFTWIPLNNPNRDAIRLAFEVHAIPLLRGRTERDLELILASERSSLYLEWIRAKRSVTELLASYH